MGHNGATWWRDDYGWYRCGYCSDRDFRTEAAVIKHLENSSLHHYCTSCDRDFDSPAVLRSHYANSSLHSFCTLCDTHWDDKNDQRGHYDRVHYQCEACTSIFATELGRYEHGRQAHPFCDDHRRAFRSPANLQAHRNSSQHKSATVACPTGCGRSFINNAAAILHLEAGSCTSGLNRARINYFVQQLDRQGTFTTSSQRLLTAPPGGPGSVSHGQWVASEGSYDAYLGRYRCVLCNNTFTDLRGLNQHLLSPRHSYGNGAAPGSEDKLYKCPNVACAKKFATLSGLVQHAEAGGCGVMRIRGVQQTFDSVMGGMKRLAL